MKLPTTPQEFATTFSEAIAVSAPDGDTSGMLSSKSIRMLLAMAIGSLVACGGGTPGPSDGGACSGTPGVSIARCGSGTPSYQQCLEYTGAFWNATNAEAACTEEFSATTSSCPTAASVGRCLRNCGRPDETIETFYSDGPTTFNAAIAEAVCRAYGGDAVAPVWIP